MRRRRQVPKPELVGPHKSGNLTTPTSNNPWRWRIIVIACGCILATVFGLLLYGPWLQITKVAVTGTKVLDPRSVSQTAIKYLNTRRWVIFPNRTIWILSAPGLTSNLAEKINHRLSIDRVVVIKQPPHQIQINITERSIVANWSNGVAMGTIDQRGTIIDLRSNAISDRPTIVDETGASFAINQNVIKRSVMTALQQLFSLMTLADLKVTDYFIPVPKCPIAVTPHDLNTNIASNINNNVNINALNSNVANINTPVVVENCDLTQAKYNTQEIHLQLVNGPRVLFDRQTNLANAVSALQRVLTSNAGTPIKQIDVRFPDRAYIE